MTNPQTLFFLGATGYIGSQFLVSVKKDATVYAKLKEFTLVALVRDPESDKSKQLLELWPGIVLVKGTLDDSAIVEEQASKSDIAFNSASSDHEPSVKAIIAGLQKRSAANPDKKQPLYIHISGLAIISDNSRGEKVPVESIANYSDATFKLDSVPETSVHHSTDRLVYAAGTQETNPIRTILAYPAVTYGQADGLTPDCPLYRILAKLFVQSGIVGTWGPGHNKIGAVHIRDVGTAFSAIFKLVLEGKAKEKDEGFYFITSEKTEPLIMKRLAEEMGKILHECGLVKDPQVKPFPEAVIGAFGESGWAGFGGNWSTAIPERLREAGWEPLETQKLSIWESLPLEV